MAKNQEKKRKLDRESLGQRASTKRVRKIETGQLPDGPDVDESKTLSSLDDSQAGDAKEKSQKRQQGSFTAKEKLNIGRRSLEQSSKLLHSEDENVAQTARGSPNDEKANAENRSKISRPKQRDASTASTSEGERALHAVAGSGSRQTGGSAAVEDEDNGLKVMKIRTSSGRYGWGVSPQCGGTYTDQDPVFVKDEHGESCIISASRHEVLLMSLETSHVIRSYAVPDGSYINSFCLSSSDEDLQIAYQNGEVVRWNWKTSAIARADFRTHGQITSMLNTLSPSKKAETYAIVQRNADSLILRNGETLFQAKSKLMALQTFRGASHIIALTSSALIVGNKDENQPISTGGEVGSSYTWVQIPCSKYSFTCFDARISEESTTSKKNKSRSIKLTVAVGNEHGQIYLYSDVLSLFSSNAQLPVPRILHWHPERVSTVRFTESGYYLLSGGKETVLVFWQLDTGKRSYLPHLPAEIERLVPNPDGTQYALLLGDNSILVLNATELKPMANFSGLQIPTITARKSSPTLPKITAALHPRNAHHLLLTVPASSPKRPTDITARPFLQTFDTQNSRHVGRQALARNTITDFNTGPDMRPVIPPDVHLLAVSQDGRWLATLDEWIPQALDLRHLVPRSTALNQMELEEVQEQQQKREEVFLKFWRWQDREQTWALNTRIESPHGSAMDTHVSTGPGQVFELVADPTSNGFVTIGQDAHVKIWQPRLRTRHGVPLKNGDKEELVEWVCKRDVSLPTFKGENELVDSPIDFLITAAMHQSAEDATLAISEDGSVIACALLPASPDSHPVVHFISPTTGDITASKTYLATPGSNLVAMAFLKQYFITLSAGAVRVWDLIEDELEYTIDLPKVKGDTDEPVLAVDPESETFAVLSHSPSDPSGSLRKVQIYAPRNRGCMFDMAFSNTPLTVLSGKQGRRYTILFNDATFRTISLNSSAARSIASDVASAQANVPFPGSTVTELASEPDMSSPRDDTDMPDGPPTYTSKDTDPFDYVEDDRPVVRPEQLASVFDTEHSASLPPVRDMFHAVVELFGRKPRLENPDRDAMDIDA